jgi:hypothetical protein
MLPNNSNEQDTFFCCDRKPCDRFVNLELSKLANGPEDNALQPRSMTLLPVRR